LELHMANCKGRPEKRGGGVTCVQCGKCFANGYTDAKSELGHHRPTASNGNSGG
uniref:C2H2-type domain-containing protein n=1 Tax=Globodera pallida TaxID=36090 RepID=A0A183CRX2_GLOPA